MATHSQLRAERAISMHRRSFGSHTQGVCFSETGGSAEEASRHPLVSPCPRSWEPARELSSALERSLWRTIPGARQLYTYIMEKWVGGIGGKMESWTSVGVSSFRAKGSWCPSSLSVHLCSSLTPCTESLQSLGLPSFRAFAHVFSSARKAFPHLLDLTVKFLKLICVVLNHQSYCFSQLTGKNLYRGAALSVCISTVSAAFSETAYIESGGGWAALGHDPSLLFHSNPSPETLLFL